MRALCVCWSFLIVLDVVILRSSAVVSHKVTVRKNIQLDHHYVRAGPLPQPAPEDLLTFQDADPSPTRSSSVAFNEDFLWTKPNDLTIGGSNKAPSWNGSRQRSSHDALPLKLGIPVVNKVAEAMSGNLMNKTEGELAGVNRNGVGDTAALMSSVIFSGSGFVCMFIFFSTLRRWCSAPYQRSVHDVSTEGSAWGSLYVDWLRNVLSTNAEEEIKVAGLDGWAFLEFYRLNYRIILVMSPVIIFVLVPAHYLSQDWKEDPDMDFVSRLDITNLPDGQFVWWIHAIMVWFVVLFSSSQILAAHKAFVHHRMKWLQDMPAPRGTTVMVLNIPEEHRSDKALKAYFQGLFKRAKVDRAYVARKTKRLRELVKVLECRTYEVHLSGKFEAEECVAKKTEAKMAVDEERKKVENGVENHDPLYCSSSGFVTFSGEDERLWHRLAARELYRKNTTEFVVSVAPSDPSDIHWKNVVQDHPDNWKSYLSHWLGYLCLVLLFLLWSPIVVFISSWTTLNTLEHYFPQLRDLTTQFPGIDAILEGILASAALKLFLAFLPAILLKIVENFIPFKAYAQAQAKLLTWYYLFLMIFVLLVTTISRSLIITAVGVISEPVKMIEMLASSLPGASHFYFNYVVLGWFTLAIELVRFANLAKYCFFRLVHKLTPERAKRYSEPEDPSSCGMGSRMALASLQSAITFTFCTCSPMILIPALIYFYLGRLVYGYLFIFTEAKKPDLGGVFWVDAVNQMFYSLIIYVLLMTGVLGGHAGAGDSTMVEQCAPAIVTFCALYSVWGTWKQVSVYQWESLPMEYLAAAVEAAPAKDTTVPCQDVETPARKDTSVLSFEKSMRTEKALYIQPECDCSSDQE